MLAPMSAELAGTSATGQATIFDESTKMNLNLELKSWQRRVRQSVGAITSPRHDPVSGERHRSLQIA